MYLVHNTVDQHKHVHYNLCELLVFIVSLVILSNMDDLFELNGTYDHEDDTYKHHDHAMIMGKL